MIINNLIPTNIRLTSCKDISSNRNIKNRNISCFMKLKGINIIQETKC